MKKQRQVIDSAFPGRSSVRVSAEMRGTNRLVIAVVGEGVETAGLSQIQQVLTVISSMFCVAGTEERTASSIIELLNQPVKWLLSQGVKPWIVKTLRRRNCNVFYVGDLACLNRTQFLVKYSQYLGAKPFDEIEAVFKGLGLSIGMDVKGWTRPRTPKSPVRGIKKSPAK